MPLRSEWAISREGFTFDTVLSVLKYTVFDPKKLLPLYLAALYTEKGRDIVRNRPQALRWIRILLGLGVVNRVKDYLDRGVSNNWKNDVYDWKKEIVVVTGGSDGIGAIIVKMLAERGIKVVILDIQEPKFNTPPNVHFFHCDLVSSSAIKKTTEEVRKHVGNPTVLVDNAGFTSGTDILSTSESNLNLTFQINTLAHFLLAQQYLPHMIERNHGMVVTLASMAGYVTAPRMVDYAGSKAAAIAFHEGLQAELPTIYKAPKVRTVLVCPGHVKTTLFEGFDGGDGFYQFSLDPGTVAEAIVRAILAGRSDHIMLPRRSVTVANLRAFPTWLQVALRKDSAKLMRDFKGRVVARPSKVESPGAGEESVFEEIEAAK